MQRAYGARRRLRQHHRSARHAAGWTRFPSDRTPPGARGDPAGASAGRNTGRPYALET